MNENIEMKNVKIDGMTCQACENRIKRALSKIEGIIEVEVSYIKSEANVLMDSNKVKMRNIEIEIEKVGYTIINNGEKTINKENSDSTFTLVLIGIIILGLYLIVKNTIGFNFITEISSDMGYGMLFIVGLFTSIHCIAMCGGINLSQCTGCIGCEEDGIYLKLKPSILYNTGRVISYTILGGIIGALGSLFSISLKGKAFITIFAGAFMIIMGINMLGIISYFRKFMPRLPKKFTDRIDNIKKDNMPFVVGMLNGFMPCGPLQAMQLYAMGTGSFTSGALSMFFFSIGTVPIMFSFGMISTMISSKFTKKMMKLSALLVIILGLVMSNRGLSLTGINVGNKALSAMGIELNEDGIAISKIEGERQEVTTKLESGGYKPIQVQAGIPVKWIIIVEKESLNGCNNEIIIPNYKIQRKLEIGENIIEFTPTQTGNITYTCWMGMISSKIIVK